MEMNVVRRLVVFIHAKALELLLILAFMLFIGQLCWPAVVHWWYLPSPGKIGVDRFEAATLANEFLIQLPPLYRTDQL